MGETFDYLKVFAGLPFAMRRFLQRPLTLDDAKRVVCERIQRREQNFLRSVEKNIYEYPRSPYLALLQLAGCELGDVRALVKDRGVEGTLRVLREAGVYITFEEFKGRKPLVRNGKTISIQPRDFDNPFAPRHFMVESGGSTGSGTNVGANLDYLAENAAHLILLLDTHQVRGIPTAVGVPILPGGGISFILQRSYLREATQRWYSLIGWRDTKRWLKYDLATLYILFWSNVFGGGVPMPTTIQPTEADKIARWMYEMLQREGRCLLFTSASLALRTCIAAEQAGLDLTGATVRVGGEPVTAAKVAAMERVGVRVFSGYGMVEAGGIGLGCAQPLGADDVHLSSDTFALITHPHRVESIGMTVPAFNLTTLMDTAPKVMLNFQSDDYGIVEERRCGCPLEAYGFTTHLREIRSYSKMLGEAVTLIGNEMLRILEDVLPARFGGTPLDYQLLEAEDEQGLTRLYLVIHPRIEIADEQQVIDAMLDGMRASSPTADAARAMWQHAQTIRIKRAEPQITARGKFSPLRKE
ncbi:MAG TPA: hypothetical protein VFD70_18220 [Anaerolineae bacterium]|nr:hypothetical protein [Anaerolineae bacterium]